MAAAQSHSPARCSLADLALQKIALERADVGDVEPAVQVIGLVLEGARQQILAGLFKRLALGILRADGDAFGAPHLLAETGNAQAALFAHLLAFDLDDGGVDQDQLVFRPFAVRDIDDGNLPRKADLRRGQAHALGRVHRLEHIRQELIEIRRIELGHGFRFAFEHGIAEFDYRVDHISFNGTDDVAGKSAPSRSRLGMVRSRARKQPVSA